MTTETPPRIEQFERGKLTTLEWQPAAGEPERVCFLLHGYGSNAEDLIGLGEALGQAWHARGGPLVRYVAPNASLEPDEMKGWGGRAWWPLRLSELIERLQTSAGFEELSAAVPPGMDEARDLVDEAIDRVHRKFNLNWSRTLIAGFSQGAMLGADLTIRTIDRPAGLMTLSGALIAKDAWAGHLDGRCCRVFGSHGRQDQTLPFVGGEMLSNWLRGHGFDTTFYPFEGGHTVTQDVILNLLAWLEAGESTPTPRTDSDGCDAADAT